MTRKTFKTILFTSLIATMILSVSGMIMVDAVNEDADKKMKKHKLCEKAKLIPYEGKVSTYERCLREAPGPMMDFDKEYPKFKPQYKLSDEERERLSKAPAPGRLTERTTSFTDENHEAFGTLLDIDTSNIRAVYTKNQVHVDGVTLQDNTFLYAPTILSPNYSPLEIVTFYGNEGDGLGTKKYVVVWNHNTQTFDWDTKHVIDSDFIKSYTLNWDGDDYYYGAIYNSTILGNWNAVIYNFDVKDWELWVDEIDDGPLSDGWVAWEEYYFDNNCPAELPEIKAKRIKIHHDGFWKFATSPLSSEYDSGSVCGITNAIFTANYTYWSVVD